MMVSRLFQFGRRGEWAALPLSLLLCACAMALGAPKSASSSKAQAVSAYGRLPLSFEANQGQSSDAGQYLAHGSGYGLSLTAQEAVLTLRKPSAPSAQHPHLNVFGVNPSSASAQGRRIETDGETRTAFLTDLVRMQVVGADPGSKPVAEGRLPGTVNYIRGQDPLRWHTGITTFERVRYAAVYPGIDLVYYGNQRQLEYDFVVAPGADSDAIRLHFAGASRLGVAGNGDLLIDAPNGQITFHRPDVYQTIGNGKRRVPGTFRLLADNSVGFALGRYDHARPLVIDPVLAYSTYFGGSNAEFVTAVAADANGNAYVTGLTISEDFPLTAGAFQSVNYATPSNAVSTAFISKFNASGTALLYSTYLGGIAVSNTLHQQGDYGKAIAVDASGNAYVTGYTYSADFPITSGAFQKGNQAANVHLATGFVTKLNATGTGLIYSSYLGGSLLDELTGITIDTSGNAYVAGVSFSADYPTTSGVFQKVNNSAAANGFNLVVSKINPAGSALVYSTYLGGGSSDGGTLGNIYWTNPIVVDKSGNAYVAGFTTSGDFPVTAGAYQTTNQGSFNVTVTKLNPTASKLLYSTYLGGNTTSISEGLALDSSGNAYVAGYTSDTDFPVTKGAFQTVNRADTNTSVSSTANQNGFLTKLNPTGTALVYSTYLGGTTGPWGGDQIYDLALDASGNAYVTGSAMSADFPVTTNAYQAKNAGATHCCDYTAYTSNGFLTEMNPTGTALVYSTYLGGSGTQNPDGPGGSGDSAYALALGKSGNVYVVGFTTSSNFPVTAGAFEAKYDTQQNTGFVADFNLAASSTAKDTVTTISSSANPGTPGESVVFTAAVTPESGTTVPTGVVTFSVDEGKVATVTLSSVGKATYTATSLPAGQHYVLASYSGSSLSYASGDGFNEVIAPLAPVLTPPGGTYTSQQTVTIKAPTAGAALYYTLNGTAASMFTTPYTAPISIFNTKTVTAVALAENDAYSTPVSATYTIIGSPAVLAAPATAIGTTTATLNAFVNGDGLAGQYFFRYGTTSTALTTSTAKKATAAGTTRTQVSAAVTALKSKTTYYFQVVFVTAGGTTAGAIESFTTN
jgi:hypothetical protein